MSSSLVILVIKRFEYILFSLSVMLVIVLKVIGSRITSSDVGDDISDDPRKNDTIEKLKPVTPHIIA